jgi:hypothetical protein
LGFDPPAPRSLHVLSSPNPTVPLCFPQCPANACHPAIPTLMPVTPERTSWFPSSASTSGWVSYIAGVDEKPGGKGFASGGRMKGWIRRLIFVPHAVWVSAPCPYHESRLPHRWKAFFPVRWKGVLHPFQEELTGDLAVCACQRRLRFPE